MVYARYCSTNVLDLDSFTVLGFIGLRRYRLNVKEKRVIMPVTHLQMFLGVGERANGQEFFNS